MEDVGVVPSSGTKWFSIPLSMSCMRLSRLCNVSSPCTVQSLNPSYSVESVISNDKDKDGYSLKNCTIKCRSGADDSRKVEIEHSMKMWRYDMK